MTLSEAYKLMDEEEKIAKEWMRRVAAPKKSEEAINAYGVGVRHGMIRMYNALTQEKL